MVGWSILPRMTAGPGKDGEFNMFQTAELLVGEKSWEKSCALSFSLTTTPRPRNYGEQQTKKGSR